MQNSPFIAVPFDQDRIQTIMNTYEVDHWPHPVILNGTTGEVILRNAWGKTDVNSLNGMLA